MPSLAVDEVHCWAASVARCASKISRWQALLSADEQERRARLQHDADRDRFVVTHALKRLVLARHAGVAPPALRFTTGPHGKPALELGGRALHFNLSHSADLVLLAVAVVPVGVDIEAWTPQTTFAELLDLAEVAFAPAERAALRLTPERDRTRLFFDTWCRKEAYIKATGDGVSAGLDHFDVCTDPADATLRADRRDPDACHRWRMRALAVAPGYSGAIAWLGNEETRAASLRTFQFDPLLGA